MAARIRKTHQDEIRAKFYVYEILDDNQNIIYVGKGSAGRMIVSKRHQSGHSCREVARFFDEQDAYLFEIEHIKEVNPFNNKHAGGNGSVCGFIKGKSAYVSKEVREMKRIGSRAYAARMLVNYCLAYKTLVSKVDLTNIERMQKEMYTLEIANQLNSFNIVKLMEVGYGKRS